MKYFIVKHCRKIKRFGAQRHHGGSNFCSLSLILLLGFLLTMLTTCKKPERDNPWDDKAVVNPDSWAPSSLGVTMDSPSSVTLSWKYSAITPEGFKIDRSVDGGSWQQPFRTLKNSARSFTDTVVNLQNYSYNYRVYAYIKQRHSAYDEIYAVGLPLAAFTGSPTGGTAPLTVQFTDQSTNNPTSWLWTFIGGQSTEQNPIFEFKYPGNYTVILLVENSYGSDVKVKLNYITVSESGAGETGTFTDTRDGQTYKWAKIGDQVWMAENLNYTSANSWCYGNNATYCDHYGRLYTWAAVMNGASSSSANPSGVQGVCPPGWHVPSDAEWTELVNYVVSQGYPNSNVAGGAGNALKSCRQVGSPLRWECNTSDQPRWHSHDLHYGVDGYGFSALPGAYRLTDGSFYNLGNLGFWWSSTEYSTADAWYQSIYYDNGTMGRYSGGKAGGFSLRCIRDSD